MSKVLYGYSLIEVLISMLILLIALAGFAPLWMNFIRYNRSLEMRHIAQKILEKDVSRLRLIEIEDFNEDNIKNFLGYDTSIPYGWNQSPISDSCDPGYETRLYREDDSGGRWKYILKLCIDEDYLPPYLKRAKIWIYWKDRGEIKKINGMFFVGALK